MPRRKQPGRIPLPAVEIVEIVDGDPAKPIVLAPGPGPAGRVAAALLGISRKDRFVVDCRNLTHGGETTILGAHRQLTLLELDEDERPVLRVLPGMDGELRIGVSRMSVAQMLADPALQHPEGGARLPLPNGARLRIECGPKTFFARVGGPPLLRPALSGSTVVGSGAGAAITGVFARPSEA